MCTYITEVCVLVTTRVSHARTLYANRSGVFAPPVTLTAEVEISVVAPSGEGTTEKQMVCDGFAPAPNRAELMVSVRT